MMKLQKGDRVQVVRNWNWPQSCTGRIAAPPHMPGDLEAAVTWLGCRRVVQSRRGPIELYWVSFDTPQMDGDGDGPYLAGEVETEYLRPLKAE